MYRFSESDNLFSKGKVGPDCLLLSRLIKGPTNYHIYLGISGVVRKQGSQ